MRRINLSSQSFHRDAHRHFAWMRREAPVLKVRFTRWTAAYTVARYADVDALLRDDTLVKNPAHLASGGRSYWVPKTFRPLLTSMITADGDDHRRLRSLVHRAFTPAHIRALSPRIQVIADELLEAALARGRFELIDSFARPLPGRVIAELIGLPTRDLDTFMGWSNRILRPPTPLNLLQALPALRQFIHYIDRLVAERRRHPEDDLMSRLTEAYSEGQGLRHDELIGMVFLLLIGGFETTVGLITNSVLALLERPALLAELRDDPSRIPAAIEETLRFDGPVILPEPAYARERFDLHGVTIPEGAMVVPSLLSANRDEEVFEHADEFRIDREPGRHLAYGRGPHYCLGAALARVEAEIAVAALLRRAPTLQLLKPRAELHYTTVPVLNSPTSLPIAVAG